MESGLGSTLSVSEPRLCYLPAKSVWLSISSTSKKGSHRCLPWGLSRTVNWIGDGQMHCEDLANLLSLAWWQFSASWHLLRISVPCRFTPWRLFESCRAWLCRCQTQHRENGRAVEEVIDPSIAFQKHSGNIRGIIHGFLHPSPVEWVHFYLMDHWALKMKTAVRGRKRKSQ